MKFVIHKILQNQLKVIANLKGGVAARTIRITTIRANTVMNIMMNMKSRVPGLNAVVLVRAKRTRKNDTITIKVEMRAKLPETAIEDLSTVRIKTTRRKITMLKTHDHPKEILHRVNSRGFATRTSQTAANPSRAIYSKSDKKKWTRLRTSNWRRSHPTDSLVRKTFLTENK